MKEKVSLGQLPRNESTYHFIYTGFLRGFDIDTAYDILTGFRNDESVEKTHGIEEGIEPFLNVADPFLRVTYPETVAIIRWESDNGEMLSETVTLSKAVRICQAGIFSVRMVIACKQSLSPENIVRLARAAREKLQFSFENRGEGKYSSLFELFKDGVERMVLSLCKGKLHCEWLDTGVAYDERGTPVRPESSPLLVGKNFQYPYVLTCLNLLEYKDKDIEKVIENCSGDFGSILRAKHSDFLNRKFLDRYLSCEANMSVDSRIFLTLYPRTCLFVYGDRKQHPGEETSIGVVTIVELLRMIWHGLIVTNLLQDRSIRSLRAQYRKFLADVSAQTRMGSPALTKILMDIAQLRIDIGEVLEDPIAYRRDTSHLSELYDSGVREFRIREIRSLVLAKLGQVDRLYENVIELSRRKSMESPKFE